jgi:putative OPT family oligopeptide transporter
MTSLSEQFEPKRVELTIRGVILGVLITLVFTAANVYLGLRVGLTFASSIPAAVISMAVLKAFKGATIWENNIVQTVASAAGTLSSIIFVLPGLVMVGWWTGFPFWMSFGVCVVGGVLGVMYTIPLRRALVTGSDLPYPEGVAAAEVLKVGAGSREEQADTGGDAGLLTIIVGSVVSALFAWPPSCSPPKSAPISGPPPHRRRASAVRSRWPCWARAT